jgi:hypothetical protein
MAVKYLRNAAQLRKRQAEEARSKAVYLDPLPLQTLDEYAWMRFVAESNRREAEAQTLRKISEWIVARLEDVKEDRSRETAQNK